MSENGQNTKIQSTGIQNKLMLVLIALFMVIIIAAGVIIFLLLNPKTEQAEEKEIMGARATVITQDNIQEEMSKIQEPSNGDEQYTTSMSINWHFDGLTSADAYVANDPVNSRTVYFDLFLADTGDMIYSSPFIPLGEELRGVTLDKELESGTYETILVYHLVDDNEQEITTLSVALKIYVDN